MPREGVGKRSVLTLGLASGVTECARTSRVKVKGEKFMINGLEEIVR